MEPRPEGQADPALELGLPFALYEPRPVTQPLPASVWPAVKNSLCCLWASRAVETHPGTAGGEHHAEDSRQGERRRNSWSKLGRLPEGCRSLEHRLSPFLLPCPSLLTCAWPHFCASASLCPAGRAEGCKNPAKNVACTPPSESPQHL